MKASEILRKLADLIDSQNTENTDGDHSAAQLIPVEVNNVDDTESNTFVPPLQQKLELLKKAAGVDSIYDQTCPTCGETPCVCDVTNEMSILKRNAGLNPAVINISSDDEPLDM